MQNPPILIDRIISKLRFSDYFKVDATVTADSLLDRVSKNQYLKVKKIAIAGLVTAAETSTAWELPDDAVVVDVLLNVTTNVTGKTIDIGTLSTDSGDADGFADALSVATKGIVRPGVAIDAGSAFYDTNTRGALLSSFVQGTDGDDRGLYNEMPDLSSGGKAVTYTPASATPALVADLYIMYYNLSETAE